MLRDLTIKNYRCFKDFSIDGLARVNLIVGQNNSGKTSFLEAVYLLQTRGEFLRLLQLRGEYSEIVGESSQVEREYPVAHLFGGHDPKPELAPSFQNQIQISSIEDSERGISFSLSTANVGVDNVGGTGSIQERLRGGKFDQAMHFLFPYEMRVEVAPYGSVSSYSLGENLAVRTRPLQFYQSAAPLHFIASGSTDVQLLARLWDMIAEFPEREREVVAALQILDPSVIDIRLASTHTAGTFLVGRKGLRSRIPLSSLGDGLRRMLALSISAIGSEDNILLVDEIDTGLYHTTQVDMWRLLIETAQRLNIQIFATTHSWDCVEAFQEAFKQDSHVENNEPLGLLFRIETRNGVLRKVKYDLRDLEIAVEQDIEVR